MDTYTEEEYHWVKTRYAVGLYLLRGNVTIGRDLFVIATSNFSIKISALTANRSYKVKNNGRGLVRTCDIHHKYNTIALSSVLLLGRPRTLVREVFTSALA